MWVNYIIYISRTTASNSTCSCSKKRPHVQTPGLHLWRWVKCAIRRRFASVSCTSRTVLGFCFCFRCRFCPLRPRLHTLSALLYNCTLSDNRSCSLLNPGFFRFRDLACVFSNSFGRGCRLTLASLSGFLLSPLAFAFALPPTTPLALPERLVIKLLVPISASTSLEHLSDFLLCLVVAQSQKLIMRSELQKERSKVIRLRYWNTQLAIYMCV